MFECYDYSVRHFTLDRTDIWKIVGTCPESGGKRKMA
jgi:hypothetical protein